MNPKRLKKNRNLIYFAPGIHQLPGDTLNVPSGKTVYIAGGAVVRGCIRAKDARDIKIFGRGEVHPEGRGAGVSIIRSKNVEVEGLITTQCPTGGSDSVAMQHSTLWADVAHPIFIGEHVERVTFTK